MLATVLDRKTGYTTTGGTKYHYWNADVMSATDYYPGGMMMPGRNTEFRWNRLGAQGSVKDDEIYGKGNFIDMGDRHLDTRILRTPKVDVKASMYPNISPYSYVGNMFTMATDPNGKNIYFVTGKSNDSRTAELNRSNFLAIANVLNSTDQGKSYIAEYINNPKKDVYITIVDQLPNSDLGQTLIIEDYGTGEVSGPSIENGGFSISSVFKTSFSNFDGIKPLGTASEIQLMSISNKDALGDGYDLSKKYSTEFAISKKGARTLGHEFGSHVKKVGLGLNYDQQHRSYGETKYSGPFEFGEGEAKGLNSKIEGLKIKNVSNDLNLQNTSEDGTYQLQNKKD